MWSVRIFLTSESVEPGLSDSKTVYSMIWWWILFSIDFDLMFVGDKDDNDEDDDDVSRWGCGTVMNV